MGESKPDDSAHTRVTKKMKEKKIQIAARAVPFLETKSGLAE